MKPSVGNVEKNTYGTAGWLSLSSDPWKKRRWDSMLSKLVRKIKRFFHPRPFLVFHCPVCRINLNYTKPLFADMRTFYFTYKCDDCTWISSWDFSFPTPLEVNRHTHCYFLGFYSLNCRKPIADTRNFIYDIRPSH